MEYEIQPRISRHLNYVLDLFVSSTNIKVAPFFPHYNYILVYNKEHKYFMRIMSGENLSCHIDNINQWKNNIYI